MSSRPFMLKSRIRPLTSLALTLLLWSNVLCQTIPHMRGQRAAAAPVPASTSHVDLLLRAGAPGANSHTRPSSRGRAEAGAQLSLSETYGRLPLSFEANRGQTDPRVSFLARGDGYGLFLTEREAVMVLRGAKTGGGTSKRPRWSGDSRPRASSGTVLRISPAGASAEVSVTGLEELPGRSNYFIGSDASKWTTAVPGFAKVRYEGLYPGINLVYYGNQRSLETDFIVAPGADPGRIKLDFKGARKLFIDKSGELVVVVNGGEVRQNAPLIYQEKDGQRQEVAGRYVLTGREQVGFRVGSYDRERPLVIDPVLDYSTYLGGSGNDVGNDITLDASNNAYITGVTASTNFPTLNPKQSTNLGLNDVFVTKLSASGSSLIYSTYLGGTVNSRVTGSGDDQGKSIAVDASGNAYVAGLTTSSNYPVTTGVFKATYGGSQDGFVTKFGPTGSALVYSTYLGGSASDDATGIAIDGSGNAYVSGSSASTNYPVTAGAFRTTNSGASDVVVTKLNPAGTAAVYSTYIGGSSNDTAFAIALDASNNAYITGDTVSTNYPTANAFQSQLSGQERFGPSIDAIITKLNPTGTALVYSTYLGGVTPVPDAFGVNFASDFGRAIAVDASGSAYVAGETGSIDFPTASAYQYYNSSYSTTCFVTKLSPAGSALSYSTYLGGGNPSSLLAIAVDSSGSAYVAGYTLASDYPTVNALQPTFHNSTSGGVDAVLTKLNPAGYALDFSTFLGGTEEDRAFGISLDANGNVYVTGFTYATDYPAAGAVQAANAGGQDVFITKISPVNGYGVSGHIADTGGASVNGVTVTLSGGQNSTTKTDANGDYAFVNLAPGRNYTITPSLPPYSFIPPSQTFNNLSANQTANFQIATYSIAGHVRDGAGAGVGSVTVALSGTQTASALTDSDGAYSFFNLAQGGNYTVTPSKSDLILTYSFTPASRSYSNISADQTADFISNPTINSQLSPSADAYVQDGTNAGANFGTATPLKVQTGTKTNVGTNMDAYLKFDLSGVGQNISSAKLRISASLSAAGSVSTSAYPVATTSWIESGAGSITWNNRPARGATAITGASATVASTTAATFDLDITSYVKSEKSAGRDEVSIALHDAAASSVFINVSSREAATGKPQLIVASSAGPNSAPAVTLTAPANGATFGAPASVSFSANATDDGSVSRVDFYAGTNLVGTSSTPASGNTYNFTWNNVAAGSYSLYAIATDNSGLTTTSTTSVVTVGAQNSPPTAVVTSPLNGATYSAGANVTLSAKASDADGSVSKVEFFAGASLVGTATIPVNGVYSVTWVNVNTGAYSITARATDNANGATTSSAVNLNVVAPVGLSPTADAYVRDGASATTNFGTATTLQTKASATTGENRETYLKFDLTTVTGITKATLRLYGSLSDATGSNVPAGVYPVATTTWVESGSGSLTWNTKPAAGASLLATATVKDTAARWSEWDITSYLQAEKAAGRNVVSLAVKNTAQSSPFASFNSKEAATNQPQLLLWSPQPRNALLVVGSATLNTGDAAARTRLQNLGFTVTVKAAGSTTNTAVKPTDADGKTLVVLSSTVTPANVTNKFRNVAVPVIDWEFDILDDMGMTGLTSGTDYGTTSTTQTQLSVTDASHPLAAGLSGTAAVATTATNFTWGKPNTNAARVAALTSDATRFSVFGYEAGAAMPGLEAPARRVALFLTDTTAAGLSPNGVALFDAAAKWASDLNTAPTINSLTPISGPMGTVVTISGLNFGTAQGASTLTFNGVAATPTSWSDRGIVTPVPAYAVTGPVLVTVNGVPSNALIFAVGEVDSDGDGLPDAWELQYFGNLGQNGAGDPDGDGYTNSQEFQLGMNPTKPGLPDTNNVINLKVHTPLEPRP